MKKGTRGWRVVNERRYARVRIGEDRRESFALTGVRNDEEADARAAVIADVAARLTRAGRADRVKPFGDALAHATSAREIAKVLETVDRACEQAAAATGSTTFKQFAEKWTSGELHKLFPDLVPAVDHSANVGRLEKHVYPVIGPVPISRLTLEDAELVMSRLPASLAPASRRHVAQLLIRVARLATYPGKVLAVCPIPRGFLPKKTSDKAKPYLYPAEDARLLGTKSIELARRVAYGILAREGMRVGELLGCTDPRRERAPLAWTDVDLEHGTITLDVNKTDDPRSWKLDPGVLVALKAWHVHSGRPSAKASVIPRALVDDLNHFARQFRGDLKKAKVDREKLFERSATRSPIRVHDLRATFVTLALANGKTETWVSDRTGHRSSVMIARYRRAAREASEIGLGELKPLDQAIPELSGKKKGAKR